MNDVPIGDAEVRALCAGVSAEELMRNLRELARWIKLSGTPEELESLQFVRSRMDAYGYRTEILRHPAYISLPGQARVEADGRTLPCITHSFSRPSGPEGLRGTLVHVGAGDEAGFAGKDLRGRIALIDGMARPEASARASRAGAAGQLHVNPDEHVHEMCISPVWGSPSADTVAHLPSTVVVTVAHAHGNPLRARVQAGESVEVTLHAQVDTGWRETPILVAELDAPETAAGAEADGAPFVMFSGHHDTWHYGVMDNGAANCTMMEVARLLAPRRTEWRRGLRFLFWSGHSHGRYSGSTWYADTHFEELDRRCVAHVNADSTGAVGATVLTDTGACGELWSLAREAIRAQAGQEYRGRRSGRLGDQSFYGIGIPAVFCSLSSQPEGMQLGWWWHTPDDLLDKIDPENLARDTRVFLHTTWRLLSAEVLPFDHAEQAGLLLAELDGLRESLDGRVSLERPAALARELAQEARRVAALGASATGEAAFRINRALVGVSRALVPLDYTRGDRFTPDPALALPPWPALQPLRGLAASAPGTDAEGFHRVGALRAANRLTHALRDALAALRAVPGGAG